MNLLKEMTWATRRIVRRPMSALGIVLTLTLGIGLSVGMFSVLHGVIIESLPYPDANRIVNIHTHNLEQGVGRGNLTPAEASEALADVPGMDRTAYYYWGGYTFLGDDSPRELSGLHVSGDYFGVFATQAAMGRTLDATDASEFREVMVLSHDAWMNLTGGDPGIIGKTLQFRDGNYEIVGVLPQSFQHPARGRVVYRPVAQANMEANRPVYLNARFLSGVGRLSEDTPLAFATQAFNARLAAVNDANSMPDRGWRVGVTSMHDDLVGDVRQVLFALFAVTLLVMLVACSNSASLVFIRLDQRKAELAVRRALGASNSRVVTDVAVEVCILVVIAAGAGIFLANGMLEILKPMAAGSLPRADGITLDGRAVAFASLMAALCAILSVVAPLWRVIQVRPSESLRGGSHREVSGSQRIAWLPALGIGLSTIALVTALALVVSLVRLGNVDPGFRTAGVTALQLWRGPPQQVPAFIEQVTEQLRAVPGVTAVSARSISPLSVAGRFTVDLQVRGRQELEPVQANLLRGLPGSNRFLEIPIVRGRDLAATDTDGSPGVVLINETLARRVFGDAEPIGEVLMLPLGEGPRVPFEIIGVTADTRNSGIRAPTDPELMVSYLQSPMAGVTFLVESALMPPNWTETLRRAVFAVDPQQAVFRAFTLDSELAGQTREARFFAATTGWFSVFALLLGAAGVNAVVAAMQRRRTREIGVRVALGARPRDAAQLVFANAMRIVAVGLLVGALLVFPTQGWLHSQLFGVGPGAFWGLYALTSVLLMAAALAAAAWPALRASRVPPMEALRYE